MADVLLYHNPRCSNSRRALEYLLEHKVDVEVVEYLKTPLDADTLRGLIGQLVDPVADLVRHDQRFKDLGLDPSGYTEVGPVIELLVDEPALMQRPVVVFDGRARIARPPEATLEALLG